MFQKGFYANNDIDSILSEVVVKESDVLLFVSK